MAVGQHGNPADRAQPARRTRHDRCRPCRRHSGPRHPPPQRDEGIAYAQALAAAGVPVQQIRGRGHTHTSLTMVDVVISGAPVRAEMAAALRGFFGAGQPFN